MSEVTVELKGEDVAAWLARFGAALSPERVTQTASRRLLTLIRRHFRANVATRHATAERLNATPTKFWDGPSSYIQLQSGGAEDVISIKHPGIARAVRDVEIRPRTGKALTLPLHAIAYGRTVAEVQRMHNKKLFRLKKSPILAMQADDGSVLPLYLLKGAVFQKQDKTLLPDEKTQEDALTDALEIEILTLARSLSGLTP